MSIHADWRKNFHNNFNQSRDGQPKYITFVDFMGHRDLGGKTILWLIDALYGCKKVDGAPRPPLDPAALQRPVALLAAGQPRPPWPSTW